MHDRILVPLDLSEESESVFRSANELLSPDGVGVLVHIIPPGKTKSMGAFVQLGSEQEEDQRAKAMVQLRRIANETGHGAGRWRCEVCVASSVADGIADIARREEADLIVMYTHERNGLSKLIKGSIAEKVRKRAATEVRLFRSHELTPV